MKTRSFPYAILASFQFYSYNSSDKIRRLGGDRNKNHNIPTSTSTSTSSIMPPPSTHTNQTHARHQSVAEPKSQSSSSSSSSRSYHFWRKHRRAHSTSTSIPNTSLSLAPISLPIQTTTHQQALKPPKRLHDRPPLNLERIDAYTKVSSEEVPIVFLSPIRTYTKQTACPLTIQTHPRPPFEATRSAPCTPWSLGPRIPPPNLSKALPILPLVAVTAPYEEIGPAPSIPLPPTPSSRNESLRPSVSVRVDQARRPLLHARSSSVPYLEVPFRLKPPPRSLLRASSPERAPQMPLRQATARPSPLLSANMTSRRPSRPSIDDLPPPLKSPARSSLYPAALLSPRLPAMSFTPTPTTSPSPHPNTNTEMETPPSPSSAAPAAMTSLLSEVLTIMNSIMSSQPSLFSSSTFHDQDEILTELTDLVIIMQQEAEDLLTLADLVEEYVEEVDIADQVAEIEDFVSDLEYYGSEQRESVEGRGQKGHCREDSAVSLDADFHAGELKESVYRVVPITIIRSAPNNREINEIRTRGSQSLEPIILKPVSATVIDKNPPLIQDPTPRRLAAKKSLSQFRDSGVGWSTPNRSSKSSVKSQSSKRKGPRWMRSRNGDEGGAVPRT